MSEAAQACRYGQQVRGVLLVFAVVGVMVLIPSHAIAATILPGYDLFITHPGTRFLGEDFTGVPIDCCFNFGPGIGLVDVGKVDTIIRRKEAAVVPGESGPAPRIETEIVALQLVSVRPIYPDPEDDGKLKHVYVTLRSGMPSTGWMDVTFDDDAGGRFDSFFDVFFDLRIGGVEGRILAPEPPPLPLTATGVPWDRTPPEGALEITGVNRYLKGDEDRSGDMWAGAGTPPRPGETCCHRHDPVVHDKPETAKHVVGHTVPEPSSFLLLGTAGFAVAGYVLRRRRELR